MKLDSIFEVDYLSAHDTDTERMCGCCGKLKPVSEFYKDGQDNQGRTRYRRDCKDCYKAQRIRDAKRKR